MSADVPDILGNLRSLRTFGAVPRSFPSSPNDEACDNLIGKALRVWDEDHTKAIGYVARAARFPYDNDELTFPALWAAHMALFNDVCDAAEESDIDDRRWLDAAVDLLNSADTIGRVEIADVLRTLAHDYKLSKHEERTIAAACSGIPEPEDPVDPAYTEECVRDRTLTLVALAAAYRAAREESK